MNSDALIRECVKYFKSRPEFRRTFELMRKKWKSYGRASGRIEIKNPSDAELEALGGFLNKDFYDSSLRFSLNQFEQALAGTRFNNVTLEGLLSGYFSEELVTNREARDIKAEKREGFFAELLEDTEKEYGENSDSYTWLKSAADKKQGYNRIVQIYKKSPAEAGDQVRQVCAALEYLNTHKNVRMAVLGAVVTRNPHAFDKKTDAGELLLHALSCLHEGAGTANAEETLMLYYTAGIIPDDLSSFTAAFGVHLCIGGGLHPAYEGFISLGEPYVITLKNLTSITRAYAKSGRVYAVENQMVFSHLCDLAEGREAAIICTSGRMKTASWMLLDLLARSGCRIYYSGDFDPEGLEIAERLLYRYTEKAELFCMGLVECRTAASDKKLSEKRINALGKISHPALKEVKEELIRTKTAGYQEQLLEKLAAEIFRE